MTENLLMQSASITLIGMSVVLLFLLILVGLMKTMSLFVLWMEKYFPQAVPVSSAEATDKTLLAIAIAAAKKFQNN